jgi:hypothetical protein
MRSVAVLPDRVLASRAPVIVGVLQIVTEHPDNRGVDTIANAETRVLLPGRFLRFANRAEAGYGVRSAPGRAEARTRASAPVKGR